MNNEELQLMIEKLQRQVNDLTEQINKNNFSAYQEFNKVSNFSNGLITPVATSLPAKGTYGELLTVNGKLYHCDNNGTFNEK